MHMPDGNGTTKARHKPATSRGRHPAGVRQEAKYYGLAPVAFCGDIPGDGVRQEAKYYGLAPVAYGDWYGRACRGHLF
jgi:hypothetical protein